jgi:hypothetical protein
MTITPGEYMDILSHISTIAEKAPQSERYCRLLEELRTEALRQMERIHLPMADQEK